MKKGLAASILMLIPAIAQKPAPQMLYAGRCHNSGDSVIKVRLNCADTTGSPFCGSLSSTLRTLPKTEVAYADADSDVFLRVFVTEQGGGWYLAQPLLFPNGRTTGATHYLKEGGININAEYSTLGSIIVRNYVAPALEPLRESIEKNALHGRSCGSITDEEDHEQ